MSEIEWVESGMRFRFQEENCYLIETGHPYLDIKSQGVRACDFVFLEEKTNKTILYFIEAKSSTPNFSNSKYNSSDFIKEITEKFLHSLLLILGIKLNRHYNKVDPLPLTIRNIDISVTKINFCLIIRGHKKEWLKDLQDLLRKNLRPIIKSFSLNDVLVINDELARKYRLVD